LKKTCDKHTQQRTSAHEVASCQEIMSVQLYADASLAASSELRVLA